MFKNRLFLWLLGLSIAYVVVAILNAWSYAAWDNAMLEQNHLQGQLQHAELLNGFARQLEYRMVLDSAHDPRMVEILKKQGINVRVTAVVQDVSREPKPSAEERDVMMNSF